MNGAQVQAAGDNLIVLFTVERNAATAAAERERGADDGGKADLFDRAFGVAHVLDHLARGRLQADPLHGLLEEQPVLGNFHGHQLGTDHLDVVFFEDAAFGQLDGQVQGGLPADRRQQRIGLLAGDDLGDELRRQRFHVGPVGKIRVGHDGRRVRVDQNDLVPLLLERLAGLRTRIVELAALSDDDRAGTDNQNL